MSDLVLAIDASTTGCKALVFDAEGRILAQGSAPIALENPAPGGWEQDAEHWWRALTDACGQLGTWRDRVRVVAVTHQRETFVLCGRDGVPRGPAIVWMDERATAQVGRYLARDAELHALTGKPVCLTPSFYKALWLREAHPERFAGDVVLCDVFAYLSHRLTGRFATSLASADPTGLLSMRDADWSAELLGALGLDERSVPSLVPVGAVLGTLTAGAASELGLSIGIEVVATAGDGQCAGLGAGIVGLDSAYLNLGTAMVSGVCAPSYQTDRAFRTLYAAVPGGYQLETDLKGGTFTLNWLASLTGAKDVAAALAKLEREASTLPPGAGGLRCLPYFCGVMNPYWDDAAGGAFVGLRGDHGPAHLYRAVLEGLALEQRLHTDAVQASTGVPVETFVVMGGGSRSDLFCQIVADATGRTVVRSGTSEATALGAAILGSVSAGLHGDVATGVRVMTSRGHSFVPGPAQSVYRGLFPSYAALYPTLRDVARAAHGQTLTV